VPLIQVAQLSLTLRQPFTSSPRRSDREILDAETGGPQVYVTPVRVGAFQTHAQAHAARGYLDAHGIDCTVVADDCHGLDPELAFATSRVTLLVDPGQAWEARELLNQMEPPGAKDSRRGELVAAVLILGFILSLVFLAFAVT
jgi:hypothetical protein